MFGVQFSMIVCPVRSETCLPSLASHCCLRHSSRQSYFCLRDNLEYLAFMLAECSCSVPICTCYHVTAWFCYCYCLPVHFCRAVRNVQLFHAHLQLFSSFCSSRLSLFSSLSCDMYSVMKTKICPSVGLCKVACRSVRVAVSKQWKRSEEIEEISKRKRKEWQERRYGYKV